MRNLKPAAQRQLVQRHNITYDKTTVPTIYGGPVIACCPPFFDLSCTDGSVGIFNTGGEHELAMRWFGIRRARAVREEINYLSYMGGVRRTAGDLSLPGVPATICEPGDGVTWGTICQDIKTCFGMIKLTSDPLISGGNQLPYCERDPRVTIDGQEIGSDEQWFESVLSESMIQTWVYNLMWGVRDANNPMGHYGLWSLLGGYGDPLKDYQYPCNEIKPKLLDWSGNDVCAATPMPGITLNGQALNAPFRTNLYSTLRDIFRAFKRQISRTRGLAAGSFEVGSFAIMGNPIVFECLMACQVCFVECANDYMRMDSERAAIALQELRSGGLENYGYLSFDGFVVPLIPFDPTLISTTSGTTSELSGLTNPDGTFNLLFLFRGNGNNRVLQPEFNPLDDSPFPTRDSGLIQVFSDVSDICTKMGMRSEWRWHKTGMMFQLLIKNVKCDSILPTNLTTSFTAATANCP